MSDNKIVPIFKNVAPLHKALGIIDAALTQRDENTVARQIRSMLCDKTPADVVTKIAKQSLKTVKSWDTPYQMMNIAAQIMVADKLPPALLDNALEHYLDAASSVADSHPIAAMGACLYAYRFSLNTPHETRIYLEAAALCENPHPALAYPLLEGALELYECASETDMGDVLKGHVLAMIETVAAHNVTGAMESYSYALDIISPDDAQFQPLLEKTFALCEKAAPHSREDVFCVLEQIVRYADHKDPLHQRATALKDTLAKALEQGNYSKATPLTPNEFLAPKPPQPL